jgi:hypothetical protein
VETTKTSATDRRHLMPPSPKHTHGYPFGQADRRDPGAASAHSATDGPGCAEASPPRPRLGNHRVTTLRVFVGPSRMCSLSRTSKPVWRCPICQALSSPWASAKTSMCWSSYLGLFVRTASTGVIWTPTDSLFCIELVHTFAHGNPCSWAKKRCCGTRPCGYMRRCSIGSLTDVFDRGGAAIFYRDLKHQR